MRKIISFSKEINQELKNELAKAYTLNNVRLYRVIQALLYIGDKDCDFSFTKIASLMDVTRKTVTNWFKNFACGGLDWLRNDPFNFKTRGRKARLNKEQKKELYKRIDAGPEKNGFYSGVWNSAMIAELIFIKFGVQYNLRYLFTFKKNGLELSKGEIYTRQM